jgi:hypothetical protein
MKTIFRSFILLSIIALISSCEKDEGKLPTISFKTGGSYTSANASLAASTSVTMGITAAKAEKKDVLRKFNISKSVNGAAATTVFSKDLSGSEEDNFSNDYTDAIGSTSGETDKYTFTITNRDGLVNQVSLTLTVL